MELPERAVFFGSSKPRVKPAPDQLNPLNTTHALSDTPSSFHHTPNSLDILGFFGGGGKKKKPKEGIPETTKLPPGATRKSLLSGWEAVQEDSLNLQRGKEQAEDLQTFDKKSNAAKKGVETKRLRAQAKTAEEARKKHPNRPQPSDSRGRPKATPNEPSDSWYD